MFQHFRRIFIETSKTKFYCIRQVLFYEKKYDHKKREKVAENLAGEENI